METKTKVKFQPKKATEEFKISGNWVEQSQALKDKFPKLTDSDVKFEVGKEASRKFISPDRVESLRGTSNLKRKREKGKQKSTSHSLQKIIVFVEPFHTKKRHKPPKH